MTTTTATTIPELPFVLPGENVTKWIVEPDPKIVVKLGTGLRWESSPSRGAANPTVYATVAGQLTQSKSSNHTFFVQSVADDGRYQPLLHDRVVGVVEDRFGSDGAGGDLYRIHIGAGHTATLSNLAFEGATKRNKPSLKPGQVLYARVAAVHVHLELELSCQLGPLDMGQGMTRRDWMTDEGCYGILQGGTVLRVAHDWTRRDLLPSQQHVVWRELAAAAAAKNNSTTTTLAGEVAVGANGWIWMHAASSSATVMLYNILRNAPVLTEAQTRAMVRQILLAHQRQQRQDANRMDED